VLARLKEITPDGVQLFDPLPSDVPPAVTAAACWQLAAYYDDERSASTAASGTGGRDAPADSKTRGIAPDATAATDS